MAYVFTPAEKTFLHGQKTGQWTGVLDLTTAPFETKTWSGLTFPIYRDTAQTGKLKSHKESALKKALEELRAAGILWQQADAHFKVIIHSNGESRGVVYLETPVTSKPTVILQMGTRSTQHVKIFANKGDRPDQNQPACDTAGGIGMMPGRILADRIYDYYKPTTTVSAKDRCTLSQVYHEFGHIFHQLTHADHFRMNGDIAVGGAKLNNPGVPAQQAFLAPAKARGVRYVSDIAGKGDRCMNEYVAETFSGIMMGINWSNVDGNGHVMQTYADLGGAVPPTPPGEISRRQAFIDQRCACPGTPGAKIDLI